MKPGGLAPGRVGFKATAWLRSAQPRSPSLRRRAARIYQRAGNIEKGIGHLEMGIQMSPGDPELWIRLGGLESARENLPDAYVAYRRAAELSPDNPLVADTDKDGLETN